MNWKDFVKSEPKLNWRYSERVLYCADLDRALAKDRLLRLFAATREDRIIDEVC